MNDSRSILIVDDDTVFRSRLGKAFADRGFRVSTAANFDEALDLAQRARFDLATVDLRMEGKSGLEVVQELRKLQPDTRVLVLTGFGSIATAVEAIRLGATNYLSKPADFEEILSAFEVTSLAEFEETYQRPSLARKEWEYIHQQLTECGGNISETARRLGMHRRTLQRKLAKFPPEGPPPTS